VNRSLGLAAAAGFIAAIVAANYVTTRYGFVGVGLGLTATAGTYLAGLALGLRDVIQEGLGRLAVFAVILIGAAISYAVSSHQIAVASAVAVLLSEAADMAVYTPLRRRMWPLAVLLSNTVGAFVDTVVFLWIAGFFAWGAVEGQMVGKVIWATLVPLGLIYAIRSARPLAPRPRQVTEAEALGIVGRRLYP
jgi:queuosine precursor transporter